MFSEPYLNVKVVFVREWVLCDGSCLNTSQPSQMYHITWQRSIRAGSKSQWSQMTLAYFHGLWLRPYIQPQGYIKRTLSRIQSQALKVKKCQN